MGKVNITKKMKDTYERWCNSPELRGIRIGPGNSGGEPQSVFIKATVKKSDKQNSEHVLVHDPAKEKLIYVVRQIKDPDSIGKAVADLMKGIH